MRSVYTGCAGNDTLLKDVFFFPGLLAQGQHAQAGHRILRCLCSPAVGTWFDNVPACVTSDVTRVNEAE